MRLLGEPRRSTYFEWKRAGDGPPRSRHARAHLLHPGHLEGAADPAARPAAADAWVRKPNTAPLFGGQSALARMLSGNVADLYVVRQYLDAIRGGS
jgi:hypothetical protein